MPLDYTLKVVEMINFMCVYVTIILKNDSYYYYLTGHLQLLVELVNVVSLPARRRNGLLQYGV